MEKKELIGHPHDGADVMMHELLGLHEDPSRGIHCHDPHYAAMLAIEAAKRVDRALCKLKRLLAKISISGEGGGSGEGGEGGEGGGNIIVQTPAVKSAYRQIFTQSQTKPERPTGGVYDFETDSLVPPIGWQNTNRFDGETDVWFSYNTFHSDNTSTGWSEPMLFVDYDKFFDRIDEQVQGIWDQMLNDANADLNKVLAEAGEILAESKEKIENAKLEIENAKKIIESSKEIIENAKQTVREAKEKLDSLNESTGEAGFEENLAKIKAFANWYDKEAATIFNLEYIIDAQNGKIQEIGRNVDTANNRVTELERTLDAKEGAIYDRIERIDGANGTIVNLRREMDAAKEKIEDNINKIDTVNGEILEMSRTMDAANKQITDNIRETNTVKNTITSLTRRMNSAEAVIEDKVEYIDTVEQRVNTVEQSLSGQDAKIEQIARTANNANSTVNQAKVTIDGYAAKIEQIATTADTAKNEATQAKIAADAVNGKIDLTVETKVDEAIKAAKIEISDQQIIAAITSSNGAGAAIVEQINKDNSSEVIIKADKIGLDGQTIAQHLSAQDLNINNGASQFNKDGSGAVANGNISWDKDGNMSIGGGLLELNPDGNISSSKLSDLPLGTVLFTTAGANPFGSKWSFLGNSTAGNVTIAGYEKTSTGADEWMNNTYNPDYSILDSLSVAMMDVNGGFYSTKNEWDAAGNPRLAGLAVSNGALRVCIDLENIKDTKPMFGYNTPTLIVPNKAVDIMIEVEDYMPSPNIDPVDGERDTVKLASAYEKFKSYPAADRTSFNYISLLEIAYEFRSTTSRTGKSCYIPGYGEANMIAKKDGLINSITKEFTGTELLKNRGYLRNVSLAVTGERYYGSNVYYYGTKAATTLSSSLTDSVLPIFKI